MGLDGTTPSNSDFDNEIIKETTEEESIKHEISGIVKS